MCIHGGAWLWETLEHPEWLFPNTGSSSKSANTATGRLKLLDESGNPVMGQNLELGTADSKCPLCLSPRTDPTSTPCGHVFCWNCVAKWCTQRPECPLCRTPVVVQELVRVFSAGF